MAVVKCICASCEADVMKSTNEYNRSKSNRFFCNLTCVANYKKKSVEVPCRECGEVFVKTASQIKKTKNNFCSQSCSGTYHNKNKKLGLRRSKFEYWIELNLSREFKDLEILYSRVDVIGLELDVYIPSLKLAFEVNGIVHKKPIYGKEKFEKIKRNDALKVSRCQEQGIELIIVDISDMPKFKSYNLSKHTEFVLTEVRKRLT